MTISNKTTIKGFFETGDKPTQQNFTDFIDSCAFLAETSAQTFAGPISVSGAFNAYGGGTLNGVTVSGATINASTFSGVTLNTPIINNPTVSAGTLNSPIISAPIVSAGTFASPNLTGIPVSTTASADTNTTQIATTAFVLGQAASQAEQEAASNTFRFVSPGRQHYHPSAAKFWVKHDDGTTINASYNVSSITDTGTGDHTINLTTSMSTADYCVLGLSANATFSVQDGAVPAAGSVRMQTRNTVGLVDGARYYVAGFGDL